MLKLKILVIITALFASEAHALTLTGGPLGLGAHALGMGGAVVAMPGGVESMFWNPAGLSGTEEPEFYAAGGTGGNFGPQDLGLGAGLGLQDWGSFGLAATDLRFPGDAGLHENVYTLGAATQVSPGFWVGTNQKILSADPGALTGWTMDAGLEAAPWTDLRFGFAAINGASTLAWGNGLQEVEPTTFEGGLAWSPFYGAWMAGEYDLIQGIDSSDGQWRAGLESAWFGRALIFRAGATQVTGSGDLFATAGLGSQFQWRGTRLSLDYAVVAPTATDSVLGSRQLLSLGLSFGNRPRQESQALLGKVLKDPRTGKIHLAKIELLPADDDVKEWQLDISDKSGKPVRSFKGRGPLPPSLSWDGKGNSGDFAEADGLSYNLRTTTHSGLQSQKRSLLAQGQPAALGLGAPLDEAGLEGGEFGLRQSGGAKRPSRVKPSLKGSSDFQVQGAEFDLSDVASAPVSKWELRIVDGQGKVVKKFSGQGRPPKSLKWEGNGDLGNTLDVGLGGSYVLRVEDDKGRATESGDDLVSADDFSRIAKGRPLAAKASIALAACSPDGQGGYRCQVPFAQGSADLGDAAWKAVEEAVSLLNRGGLGNIEIRGYAKPGESAESVTLSQARAETVLKAIVEGYELKPDAVSAKGFGENPPARKAEIIIHHGSPSEE
jgi:hypothetical protein